MLDDKIVEMERKHIEERRYLDALDNGEIRRTGLSLDCRFLFSTSSGVFLFDRGVITRLLKGFCFGLARSGGRFFCTQEDYPDADSGGYGLSRILEFSLDGCQASHVRVLCTALRPGIHQIALFGERLLHVQTDGVLNLFPLDGQGPAWTADGGSAWPLVRGGEVFRHANSLLVRETDIVVMAHNDFEKTGYMSAIKRVDFRGNVLETRSLPGRSTHDILEWNGQFLFCSSHDGTVVNGVKTVAALPKLWTRGLGLVGSFWVVGGSEKTERKDRLTTRSHLHFFSEDFSTCLATVVLGELGDGSYGGNVKCVLALPIVT